jgi:cysteine desulfurase
MSDDADQGRPDPGEVGGPVLFYNEIVIEHFMHPRNVGELAPDEANGFGLVGDPSCGDENKLYGPKGIAALLVRAGTPLVPLVTGGTHERGLRAGTENVAGIVGFAEAVALAVAGAEHEGQRQRLLRDRLEARVAAAIPAVQVNGAEAPRVPSTSSLSFADVDGESVVLGLDVRGICVSTGSACSTGDPEPSHVLCAMGLTPRAAQGSVRISLGHDTRAEDVEAVVLALEETVARLRDISSTRGDSP